MWKWTSIMLQDAQTLTNTKSSTSFKDVSTETTDKSDAKPFRAMSIPSAHELQSASLLWRAVLGQAIRDTYDLSLMNNRRDIIRWLKTPDFFTVCDMADVEATQMQEQIATLCTLSIPLAKKYGRMLRMRVMEGVHNNDP